MSDVSGTRRVLLIDDEKGVVTALSMLLKAVGYTAFPFTAPAEALNFLENNLKQTGSTGVDFVLSDLRMPELDGIEVLKIIKEQYTSLPFILMSGHATAEDQQQAAALGADGFLSKPFSPEALHAMVAELNSIGGS